MADEFDGSEFVSPVKDRTKKKEKKEPYLPGSVDELDDPVKYTDPERSMFKLFKGLLGL